MKEKTSPWLKVLALCTAIGLGGTYVWRQQQKAAAPVVKPVERLVLSSSKSLVIAPTDDKKTNLPLTPPQAEKKILLSGSKSGTFTLEQEAPKQRTLLPSSKSTTTTIVPMRDLQIPAEKKP